MNANEIIKLLDILIGETEADGDTVADEKIKKNLMKLIDVTNWCLDGIVRASKTKSRSEYSMRNIGQFAYGAMDEYKTWLTEQLECD